MPEGDAVWRTARKLHQALSGHELERTDFRVPAIATADLSGGLVIETVSRGKHLLTRIDGDRAWTLHTHLKMEGSWRVYDRGQRWNKAAHLARVVLDVADGRSGRTAVGFQLGVVELVLREHEQQVVGHLGPDLLGPDWDEQEAARRLTADPDRPLGEALLDQRNLAGAGSELSTRRVAERSIGEALLDQRCLAGIGTIYRSETLFLAGVSPFLPVTAVPDLLKVVQLARRLLLSNRERPQITTTGNTRRGEQLWAYGRAGEPCRRCGTIIKRTMQGSPPYDRVTYWCSSCQPAD